MIFFNSDNKYKAEGNFWKSEISRYVKWYKGDLEEYYGTKSPTEKEKITSVTEVMSAILTWKKMHQEKKYLKDLILDKDIFAGLKVLDIGSGPMPSAEVFENCQLYCLDPLFFKYIEIGFPIHCYGNVKFVQSFSESIPVEDNFFDAIISLNAIDHVDDFEKTAAEIKRVLRKDGKVRIHAHYHSATRTEPLELNDERFEKAFGWCKGIRKISESKVKYGSEAGAGEKYVVWSNF